MITFTISYEQTYSQEELKPVQAMILQNIPFSEMLDEVDFSLIEEAYIDLAVQFGWNAKKYVDEVLEEQANLVLSYDGENSESLSKMMSNTAIGYVECYLRGEKFDDSFDGKDVYQFK